MSTLQTETYERLKAAEKQRSGNLETARISDVDVTRDAVVLSLQFAWSTDSETLTYDLADERDVCRLVDIARSLGYEFDQLPALEGERLTVRYTERGWLPEPDADPSADSSAGAESGSSLDAVGSLAGRLRSLSTEQAVIGVILTKKLIIVSLLVYLLAF